jgi:hypothetical protein
MRYLHILSVCALGATMNASLSSDVRCCAVIELRQYTLKEEQRDALIDLFDRKLVESQEALGATVAGQFRDRRRDNRFVWLRGFSDMASRHAALEQFYGGPVWAEHKAAANDTMLDSDDVLLLKPARPDLAFRLNPRDRPVPGEAYVTRTVVAGVYPLARPADNALVSQFEREVVPILERGGVGVDGVFVTESAANTFTRLPVREGEHVLAWFGTVEQPGPQESGWLERLASASALGDLKPLLMELGPTSRSLLGHRRVSTGAHDFDFLNGSWSIHNRFLKDRLSGSHDWIEFEGALEFERRLHGLANLDRFTTLREGVAMEGMSLRFFDPLTELWSIYWADTVRAGALQPPMVGTFKDGVGEFFGDEEWRGQKVACRFRWTKTTTASPEWEQAFSADAGKTWETNWIMTFMRHTSG